jgi:hypothetical protein
VGQSREQGEGLSGFANEELSSAKKTKYHTFNCLQYSVIAALQTCTIFQFSNSPIFYTIARCKQAWHVEPSP